MFSLIITIISIALVAALALATLYYGGNAFNKGSAEANASKIINEGQQINGAVQLARADVANGTLAAAPSTVGDLVTAYLQQLPASFNDQGTVTLATGLVKTAAVSADVCDAVNVKAGFAKGATVAAATDLDGKKVFGCDTTTKVVQYAF